MIRNKQPKDEIVIDLTGPDGNAFSLMANAQNLAKQLGFNGKEIVDEMTTGDYENLISVFDKYFGHIIVLER